MAQTVTLVHVEWDDGTTARADFHALKSFTIVVTIDF